jgi:hypothetical protein
MRYWDRLRLEAAGELEGPLMLETPSARSPVATANGGPVAWFEGALSRGFGPNSPLGSAVGLAEALVAFVGGERNENRLTDIVFFARHPERGGRLIARGEVQLAQEWLWIRDQVIRPALQQAATAPPATPAPPAVTFVNEFEPLPANATGRFSAALAELERQIAASGDSRTWRYLCWLAKLKAGGDDRVIQWHRICPRISGALGAAYIVGPCDITAGSAVDQTELEAAIHAIADVEPANERLQFITYMRSNIVSTYDFAATSLQLENFRTFHDEVIRAVDNLDKWANNPMGGSSAMPPAYVAIKDWIGTRQRDATSVYSCG